ncbi:MAG: hypothetical protein GMKNLPBB_02177 [Myxococcota bacterium]|nr:hypothetical protein [Myxococcota bacterium]
MSKEPLKPVEAPSQAADGAGAKSRPALTLDQARARVRRMAEKYVERGPYGFYPDEHRVNEVIEGLARNLAEHGRMYCPCHPIEDSLKRGAEMACPCTPHHEDIARDGYCDCAFFASRGFIAGGKGKPPQG